MKSLKRYAVAFAVAVLSLVSAKAIGWPANYEGVMLQGFYWDSFTDTKWTNLETQADELSQYFKLIWVPNSGKAASNPGMGYDPVYWFTNHNSSFGTEAQLRSMINTFKAKGTGIIADVVINHRSGATNWTDFPAEKWRGNTWKIGTDGICCTDEVKDAPGQAKPTGAPDTGEDFNGSRDLDHTNLNVQNNCKNYCKFLLEDLGYAGFRYDMVKGYGGQYNKIYNQYSKPTYSVGEYWDGSYDAVKGWIEATGKESAAFDFPCKYAINKAFADNDMTQLVWKANGTTDQPAGMIHFGYAQLAVTFVDNHDTYRDGSKFTGNVVAANAFILCSPGTPCVFLPHYKQHKAAIQALINVRNAVGVHNCSEVRVLRSSRDCYMAEVTGSKGKLVVKVGSAQVTPDGYTNADIKASGNDYCVWSKVNGGGDDPTPTPTGSLYILGNLKGAAGWSTTPGTGVAMTKDGDVYTAKNVEFAAATGETKCYFNLTDYVGTTWDDLNINANRYGSAVEGEAVTPGTPATIVKYAKDVSASGCLSWTLPAGKYDISADLSTMKLTVTNAGGGDNPQKPVVTADPVSGTTFTESLSVKLSVSPAATIYYTLNGTNPTVSSSKYNAALTLTETTTVKTLAVTAAGVKSDVQTFTYTKKQGGDDPDKTYCYFINSKNWNVKVWAWNDNGNCNANGTWPGDPMVEKDGKLYWEAPAGKVPTQIIFSNNGGDKAGGGDLDFVNGATYKADGTIEGEDPRPQVEINIYFDNANSNWTTPHIHYWGNTASTWPGVAMTKVEGNIWKYTCPAGTTGILFNAGDGDATKTKDFIPVNNHVYNTDGDQGEYQGGPIGDDYPANIYMVGTINGTPWATSTGLKPDEAANGVYTWNSVKFDSASATTPEAYFTFLTVLDAADGDWNGANQGDRYGASEEGVEVSLNTPTPVKLYKNQVDAMAAKSWAAPAGIYSTVLDLKNMTVTLSNPTGVDNITVTDTDTPAVYFNLMGVRVDTPSNGVYIVRRGDKVTKEYVK